LLEAVLLSLSRRKFSPRASCSSVSEVGAAQATSTESYDEAALDFGVSAQPILLKEFDHGCHKPPSMSQLDQKRRSNDVRKTSAVPPTPVELMHRHER
jgi:hypothetical protein